MNTVLVLLCIIAFFAGFVDAIVGGGGLLQTPSALILLPQQPVATVIGTLKIPSFTGTSLASVQYARKVSFDRRQIVAMMVIAMLAAFAGSALLTVVSNRFMKPVLLVILIAVAIYTLLNKNFGTRSSLVLGFYDGFIGPGAGSFLVLSFISLLGFDFLRASAHARFVNLATNLGSIALFVIRGKIMFAIAIPMAICNGVGGMLGARLALLRGNRFIRTLFLIVVLGTIARFAYEVIVSLYPVLSS
jgi:uncharacterized membrane protein YfcA